jgi:repressor LexA
MGKEEQIYKYIRQEVSRRGLPPTIREIGSRFDISSTNGVRYFLGKLESEGLIERQTRTARGIKVIEKDIEVTGKSIPILGRVPAGDPSFSEEYIEDTLVLDEKIAGEEGVFAVRVVGDSMTGAGINEGDLVIVKRNPTPRNGEIVVAIIDEEVTLKRFVRRREQVILKPENDKYPEINLTQLGTESISIIGTVKAVIRRY